MLTCRKVYHDIPFAHRQPKHQGDCAYLHGHNWSFAFTFGCEETDENGFVVDFGRLRYLKAWLNENLDHACVFNENDPLRETLVAAAPQAFKVYLVPNCSSEGLARYLHEQLDPLVREHTNGRAFITAVEVFEDSKNSACYHVAS